MVLHTPLTADPAQFIVGSTHSIRIADIVVKCRIVEKITDHSYTVEVEDSEEKATLLVMT